MNLLLIAALLATPRLPHKEASPAPQAQQPQLSDEEVREKVDGYLGTIDRPVSADAWRALGPRAADILEPITTDPKAMPTRRAQALEGLVAVAPDRAARIVGNLARDEKQPTVVRVTAIHGAGQVLSPSKALRELKPVMESARSPGMRGAAAEVIGRTSGCGVVKEQAARERAENRPAFERALKRCKE